MNIESCLPISDEEFANILDYWWEQIALFAFSEYKKSGRGAVFLVRHSLANDILDDGVELGYTVYEPGRPDTDVARMITEYDPAWEIVFQYWRLDGNVRTARIKTAPGNRHPWRIYLFERLAEDEEEEEQ